MIRRNEPRRRGAMAYVMVLSLTFLTLLFLLLMDLGRSVREKVEMQDAADASAYSASLMMARGMNAITTTNHHMGELLSLAVLHKAIAGENVDGKDLSSSDRNEDRALSLALKGLGPAARSIGGVAATYPANSRTLRAAETVGQGKLRLKRLIAQIYSVQIAVSPWPWGRPIIAALNVFERTVVLLEWRALDRMESIARMTLPVKNLIVRVLLPAAKRYEDEVVRVTPDLAAAAAVGTAERNGCEGGLYPARPPLPIEQERVDLSSSDHQSTMAKTQMVRATFPYVNHHRAPILTHTSWMVLSGASSLYRHWTDQDTTERARAIYRSMGSTIYVMKKAEPPIKGTEVWTDDTREADLQFAVIGMAYRPTKLPFGAPILKTENRSGLVTFAQALIYNANPQKPTGSIGKLQAEVGWDTLNWRSPIATSHAYEFPEGRRGAPGSPRIFVNWQTKLVPASSFLDLAAAGTPGPFGPVLRRVTPLPQSSRTH